MRICPDDWYKYLHFGLLADGLIELYVKGGAVAKWISVRTPDREVAGSIPGTIVALFLGKEYLPLFPLLLLHFGIVSALQKFPSKI